MLLFGNEEIDNFPLKHLSYSAIRSYLTDRGSFKKRYIDANYDNDTNMPMIIGNVLHEVFAKYYTHQMEKMPVFTKEEMLADAYNLLDKAIAKNNTLIKGYTKDKRQQMFEDGFAEMEIAVNGYFEDLPVFHRIVGVEKADKVNISYNGYEYPIGLKAIIDLFYFDEQDRLRVVDHKFVGEGEEEGTVKPDFDLQAAACYFIALSIFGIAPYSMTYNQISKKVVNPFKGLQKPDLVQMCEDNGIGVDYKEKKDGTIYPTNTVEELKGRIIDAGIVEKAKQVISYEIIYEEKPYILEMFIVIFENILNEIYLISNNDIVFLPNVFDRLSGASSYQEFIFEITGTDLNAKNDILDLDM